MESSDLQSQLDRLNRRRKLADALAGRALTPINPNRSSGRYVTPISPFEGIAQVAQGFMAGNTMRGLDEEEDKVRTSHSEQLAKALSGLSEFGTTPPPITPAAALTQRAPAPMRDDMGMSQLPPAAAGAESDLLGGGPRQVSPYQDPPTMPQVDVTATPQPAKPALPTMQAYMAHLAKVSQSSGVPMDKLMAQPVAVATMKQIEELNKPRELSQGAAVFSPQHGVIAENPKLTDAESLNAGVTRAENAGNMGLVQTLNNQLRGLGVTNVQQDKTSGRLYGVKGGQPIFLDDGTPFQGRPELPSGMQYGEDGKPGYMPEYVSGQEAIKRAGKPDIATTVNVAQEKEESKAVGKGQGERFLQIQDAASLSRRKAERVDRMNQLLEGVQTGKLTPAGTEIASFAQSLGFEMDKNLGNKQAAEALANEFALELRNPSGGAGMPGAMSDKDREFLRSMSPGLEKTPDGRKQISQTYKAIAKRDEEVARMARQYRKKHGSFDEGFYDELEAFSSANPMFGEPASPSGFKIIRRPK